MGKECCRKGKRQMIILWSIISFFAGFLTSMTLVGDQIRKADKESRKKRTHENTLRREQLYDNWMMANKYGTPMEDILLRMGWHRVAIYGTQQLGVRLFHELKDTSVIVVCSFDNNPKHLIYGVPNYKTLDLNETPPLDGVIVSNFTAYDKVEKMLREAGYCSIIALDELIFRMVEDKQ